jgi:hypothetical protein
MTGDGVSFVSFRSIEASRSRGLDGDGVSAVSLRELASRSRLARAAALAAMLASSGHPARADRPRDTPTAIEVDRDTAPAGRVGFGFDGGEPVDAWGVSITASWIDRPIELGADAFGGGSPATRPVRRRETLALGGALAFGERIAIDLRLRGSHQVGDRLTAAGNPERLARWVLQDVRLGGRIRIVGVRERTALVRAELTLPTGNDQQFAGDARWTAAWSLIGRALVARDIAIAGTAGIRLHGAEVAVGDRLIGDALFAAAGVSVPLRALGLTGVAERVAVTGELIGALGDHVGDLAGPSPIEARVGAIAQLSPELAIGAHLGFGLDDQVGAPRFRALLEVAWAPRVARSAQPAAATPPASDDADEDPDPP